MQSLENKGKIKMASQDDAASCVNVTGTDRKIDAPVTQPDSPDVHGWQPIETAPIDTTVLVYGFGYEVAHHNSLLGKWVAVWDHRPIRIRPDTVWMPLPARPVLP